MGKRLGVEEEFFVKKLIGRLTAVAVLAFAGTAHAEDFYAGKQVELLIAGSVGGAYDVYARALSRWMPKHIPGNPTFVPKQMIGAGGLTAANHLYNAAPKDGTSIALVNNPVPFMPLLGEKKAMFDPAKINWIGSAAGEVALLIVWHTSPLQTLEQAQQKEMTVATAGAGSGSEFYARLLNGFLGTKLKLISGYQGSSDGLLAMERGEVDGWSDIMWSTLNATKQQWVKDNSIRILVQIALKKHPQLPDVPLAADYAKTPEDKAALELALAPLVIARPFMAPPGVPADRVKLLQDAFMATLADPGFKEDIAKLRIDTYGAMSGPDVAAFIQRMYQSTPPVVARVSALLKG
jgi:tripartite-type tricarboxylate transporter receptor subunit TctC